MKRYRLKSLLSTFLILSGLLCLTAAARVEARTTEFRFELSTDAGSEFSAKLAVSYPGPLKVEVEWKPINLQAGAAAQTTLTLILLRPNGTEAARQSGSSPLRFEMRLGEQDIDNAGDRNSRAWTAKIINGGGEPRAEVRGLLRAVIPVAAGTLVETDFVLLGSGNAREIAFPISGPGRLTLEAVWQTEQSSDASVLQPALSFILLHPGEDRVYARRQGRSPLRIEQQIAAPTLDRGARWIARIQNDGAVKVKGRLKVVFTPSL